MTHDGTLLHMASDDFEARAVPPMVGYRALSVGAIEGDQTRPRTAFHDFPECGPVFVACYPPQAAPIRQFMHQHPLPAPFSPNESSIACQRSDVSGRTLNFSLTRGSGQP